MTSVVRPHQSRLLAALLGLVAAAALALGVGAGPAAAHEGDAVVVIEAVHPAGQSIHYIVRVTWEDDGHPAADATVTATAVAPDGTQLTPVALAPADADGRYAGAVEYPAAGAWTVRVTSIDPTGTIEQPQEVTPTETTAAPDVTTGTGTDAGFAPEEDGTGASDETGGADDGQQAAAGADGGDGMPVAVIAIAAAVVIIGAVTAVGIIRRVRANPPAGTGAGTGTAGAGSPGPGPDPDGGAATERTDGDPPGRDEPAPSGTDPGRG